MIHARNATEAWEMLLATIIEHGSHVSPRGQHTLEVLHQSAKFDSRYPIVTNPRRKLSKKFLTGEAVWITDGDDRVETIAPFNKRIADFSDDGKTFFGAYGPRVVDQVPYVVRALIDDPESRQAVLTLWRRDIARFKRQHGRPSKDVPCTIAMSFNVRNDHLNTHVFMRSSDAWLGVPYDFFNFTMIGAMVACGVNRHHRARIEHLGWTHWTAVSAHLYERDREGVTACLEYAHETGYADPSGPCVPMEHLRSGDWRAFRSELVAARDERRLPWT